MTDSEIYLEYITVGQYLKVTAIDAVTGEEVSFMADPSTPKKQLEDLAIKKLRYVQEKKRPKT